MFRPRMNPPPPPVRTAAHERDDDNIVVLHSIASGACVALDRDARTVYTSNRKNARTAAQSRPSMREPRSVLPYAVRARDRLCDLARSSCYVIFSHKTWPPIWRHRGDRRHVVRRTTTTTTMVYDNACSRYVDRCSGNIFSDCETATASMVKRNCTSDLRNARILRDAFCNFDDSSRLAHTTRFKRKPVRLSSV
jgi:hypothetical protein